MVYDITRMMSHLVFILLSFNMLSKLEISKIFKANTHFRIIQFFVMFLSIALGFMVSNFFLEIVSLSGDLSESFK